MDNILNTHVWIGNVPVYVLTRCSSHPQGISEVTLMPWGWLEHLVKTSASCTPNIKLSTKNLRCFYTVVFTAIEFHNIIMAFSFLWKTSLFPILTVKLNSLLSLWVFEFRVRANCKPDILDTAITFVYEVCLHMVHDVCAFMNLSSL